MIALPLYPWCSLRMPPVFDTIIVGLGGMGSAAAFHLARRGARVLGLDRLPVPHDRGSSHGRSRIIRQAYFEGSDYVPLVQRAWTLWEELERELGRRLLTPTGGLMIGRRESSVVAGALASARALDLPHELLSTAELRRRYPRLAVPDETAALFETRAGVLDPEACVEAHLAGARAAGADLREDQAVVAIHDADASEVVVETDRERFRAHRAILAAGPWATKLAATAGLPLTALRVMTHWFLPRGELARFAPRALPIFIWEHDAVGFSGHGFKFASAIGEALAELALDGGTRLDLATLSPARFAAS